MRLLGHGLYQRLPCYTSCPYGTVVLLSRDDSGSSQSLFDRLRGQCEI